MQRYTTASGGPEVSNSSVGGVSARKMQGWIRPSKLQTSPRIQGEGDYPPYLTICRLSSHEIADHRAKGIRYNCDETYSCGH
ncbi:hypothetical protein KSP39_PZI000432 [Platanthera zijinensis]|uniref:Uncharacterized protein n=1 Tax=Platanthera zijinensis TaxID=2320716 RepID=A0AAP0C2D5_9ASPA